MTQSIDLTPVGVATAAATTLRNEQGGTINASLPSFTRDATTTAAATSAPAVRLTSIAIDESDHTRDGLLLRAWDRVDAVTVNAFISRKVIDDWVHSVEAPAKRMSLFRAEYTALGKLNLPAIQRIVATKYQDGTASDDPYPFVDVLLADITASGETLDISGLT